MYIPRAKKVRAPKAKGLNVGMTRTEERFALTLPQGAQYEGIRFKIAGNSHYTPDFVVMTEDEIHVYEVKGNFSLPSEGRARLAFLEARERWPLINFHWFVEKKRGIFEEKFF